MRKLLLSLLVVIMDTMALYAQNTLVATLTHGTDISMFYGTYALQAAHEAAVSGDIINLSGGAFQSVEINKSVILRGTGIDSDNPTYIINDLNIDIPVEEKSRLSMEGIRCTSTINIRNTFNNPYFLKCQFNDIYFNSFERSNVRKSQFVNCIMNGDVGAASGRDDVQILNSYVKNLYCSSYSGGTLTVMNCVISSIQLYGIDASLLINCILVGDGDSWSNLPPSTIATNCLSVNYPNDIFENLQQKTSCSSSTLAEVFRNFDGTYSDGQTFELTDAAKTTMLGTDGTQIGLYGGMVPYDSTPSYPQITKMNVSNKTTADGKLSVEIEVNAAK